MNTWGMKVLAGGLMLGLTACDGSLTLTPTVNDDNSITIESKVRVQMGSLGSVRLAMAPGMRLLAEELGDDETLAPSATPYAYAKIESIRILIDAIDIEGDGHGHLLAEWEDGYVLQLDGDSDGTMLFDQEMEVPHGDYTTSRVHIRNTQDVKGYGRTKNGYVYTTADGGKLVASLDDIDEDYDFLTIGAGDETHWQIVPYNFTVTDTVESRLALLVDTSFVVSCYDGTLDAYGDAGAIDPFNYDDSYDLTAPTFGVGNLQIFAFFSEVNEDTPAGETYVAHPEEAVFDDPFDYQQMYILTVIYSDAGDIMGAMARNGGQPAGLIPWYLGFEREEGDTFTLHLGGWLCDAEETDCRDDANHRSVTNFKRLVDFEEVHESTVVNGPDCQDPDEAVSDRTGCLDEPYALYWQQVPR